jgi:hypothetical protein
MDQGADNLSFLSALGVNYTRNNYTYYIPHPCDDIRRLYIIPELVHVVKNLTCNLRNHRVKLSAKLRTDYNLGSSFADFQDIIKVFNAQKKSAAKIAPRLTRVSISPNNYECMVEETAYSVISSEISFAIDILTDNGTGKKNATSFFIEHLNKLQKIFNSPTGWRKTNWEQYEADIKYLKFLRDEFFPNVHYEISRGSVKSVVGAMVAISSLIDLSADQFRMGADVVYPKHFLTNAVENIFSQITLKSSQPTALEFQHHKVFDNKWH